MNNLEDTSMFDESDVFITGSKGKAYIGRNFKQNKIPEEEWKNHLGGIEDFKIELIEFFEAL